MKIKAHLIWIAFMFGIFGLTGCTTVNTAAKAQGSGEQIVYRASFDEVWAAVPEVMTNVGLQCVSVNTDKHVFLAKPERFSQIPITVDGIRVNSGA
jgi:hypothetical protein